MFNRATFNSTKFNSVVAVSVTERKHPRFYKKRFDLIFDIKAKKATEFGLQWLIKAIRMISTKEDVKLFAKRQLDTKQRFNFAGIKHTNFDLSTNLFAQKQFDYSSRLDLTAKRSKKISMVREFLKTRHQPFSEDYNLTAKKTKQFGNRYNLNAIKQNKMNQTFSINAQKDVTNILEALDLLD